MKHQKNVVQRVEEFAKPVVTQLGYELWDIAFEKLGSMYELNIYIDRPDRAVDLNDCETVSRAIDPLLDRYDPIEEAYTFNVSSAGLERSLKKPEHFQKYIGYLVDVKLYQAMDGQKTLLGVLKAYEDATVKIETQDGMEWNIPVSGLASCRLHVSF